MKRLFLAVGIIISFILYSLNVKQSEDAIVLPQSEIIPSPLTNLNSQSPNNSSQTNTSLYNDGQYIGSVANAFYGNIQVKAIIKNGKLIDVQFLQYPHDQRQSIEINTYAMPVLTQEAVAVQSAQVDFATRATDTTIAFRESLGVALKQAQK